MLLLGIPSMLAENITLDEAQRLAEANFPLVKRYELISQTTQYTLDNITKSWFPQLSVGAQVTFQNPRSKMGDDINTIMDFRDIKVSGTVTNPQGQEVPIPEGVSFENTVVEFPEPNIKGISRLQYRIGAELNQVLYEGGLIKGQREVAKMESEVQKTKNDVDIYALRERVCDLFFGILLIDEQTRLCNEMINLLDANQGKVESLYRGGVATGGDVAAIKAEKMKAIQQRTQLQNSRRSFERVLNLFIGKPEQTSLVPQKPMETLVSNVNQRPELRLFDKQLELTQAQDRLLRASLMPTVSAFASGFYGYPGFNMMHDMMHHNPTFNVMVGLRVNWTIGSLYTFKNDQSRLLLKRSEIETARETFLFNSRLQSAQENETMAGYRRMMADDDEIIDLRVTVRKAAESKLNHGIIDVNNLLQEITKENQARISKSQHEVEMLQHLYKLKIIQNN